MKAEDGPLGRSIIKKLTDALTPERLSVRNDSHKHAGHSGNPDGSPTAETHFQVSVVSQAFEGKRPVQRHRQVYEALHEELQNGIHALALDTKTPKEAGL